MKTHCQPYCHMITTLQFANFCMCVGDVAKLWVFDSAPDLSAWQIQVLLAAVKKLLCADKLNSHSLTLFFFCNPLSSEYVACSVILWVLRSVSGGWSLHIVHSKSIPSSNYTSHNDKAENIILAFFANVFKRKNWKITLASVLRPFTQY